MAVPFIFISGYVHSYREAVASTIIYALVLQPYVAPNCIVRFQLIQTENLPCTLREICVPLWIHLSYPCHIPYAI